MKRERFTILAAIFFIAACLNVSAQQYTEQNRPVSGFSALATGGPFNIHIKINGTENLKIKAESSVINDIETMVENNTLKIKFKHENEWNHRHIGNVDIYVTAKSLTGLANAGSGDITVDGTLNGDNVNLNLGGSGNIRSSVKSGRLHASIAGSGSIHITGNSTDTKLSIAGSGQILGKEFKTNSASVNITGSGNAYLNADKTLSARIVGSGSVIYTGNAIVDSRTIGSGRVSKTN